MAVVEVSGPSSVSPARAGWAGVLGVVVPAVGLAVYPIWDFPSTTAGGAHVAAFAADHRVALQAMMLLYTVGVSLWLVFGAGVWARLAALCPRGSMLPACFAAGLIGFVTLLLAGFTAFDVLVYRHPGPGEAQLLYDLGFGLLAMSGMPTAAALTAFGVAVRRHGGLPQRTAHLALVTAAAHVVLLASFVAGSGFFSLEGFVITGVPALLWLWILDTGSCLVRLPVAGSAV